MMKVCNKNIKAIRITVIIFCKAFKNAYEYNLLYRFVQQSNIYITLKISLLEA